MITEQYVSVETAKLAKEKGFNEPCRHYYLNGAKEVNNETIMIYDLPYPYNSTDKNYFAAPTQSLLARWLREKYNVSVEVYSSVFRYQHNIRNIDSTCIGGSDYSKTNGGGAWSSYEEAMEDGLQEALKLL